MYGPKCTSHTAATRSSCVNYSMDRKCIVVYLQAYKTPPNLNGCSGYGHPCGATRSTSPTASPCSISITSQQLSAKKLARGKNTRLIKPNPNLTRCHDERSLRKAVQAGAHSLLDKPIPDRRPATAPKRLPSIAETNPTPEAAAIGPPVS